MTKEEFLDAYSRIKQTMPEDDPEVQKCLKHIDPMVEHSNAIVSVVTDGAYISDDDHWVVTMLMALARATSYIIRGLESSQHLKEDEVMNEYLNGYLYLCDMVVKNEIKEMTKAKEE